MLLVGKKSQSINACAGKNAKVGSLSARTRTKQTKWERQRLRPYERDSALNQKEIPLQNRKRWPEGIVRYVDLLPNWYWHIGQRFQTPKWIASWLIKSSLMLLLVCVCSPFTTGYIQFCIHHISTFCSFSSSVWDNHWQKSLAPVNEGSKGYFTTGAEIK